MYADAANMTPPGAELFTRWLSYLCAPSVVFLTGTSLALSVERLVKGVALNCCTVGVNSDLS
jgi:uncharacterized membrane protein